MERKNTYLLMRAFLIVAIVFLNLACDQTTKQIARNKLFPYQHVDFKSRIVNLTLTNIENKGAFLSLGRDLSGPVRLILLIILPLAALAGGLIFIIFHRKVDHVTLLASCFIIGGGTGNLCDRIRFGSVTDFIHLHFKILQTGIFNLADVSIMLGVFALFINELFFRNKSSKRSPFSG